MYVITNAGPPVDPIVVGASFMRCMSGLGPVEDSVGSGKIAR
jgi:hypothetical protein